MSQPIPSLLFGGGIVGSPDASNFTTRESVALLLDTLSKLGIQRIDTAGRYPAGHSGQSEILFGEAGVGARGFLVDSKIMVSGNSFEGTVSFDAVRKNVPGSLFRLRLNKLNTLYNHAYDPTTPLEEQAKAMSEQYRKGNCSQLGLCNLPPEVLETWLQICDDQDLEKPKVYQGIYNLIRRDAETTIFPILRKHGMSFIGFSPLAAGFLSGHYSTGNMAGEGKRMRGDSGIAKSMRAFYDKPEAHDAIHRLLEALAPLGIKPTDAALRWLCYHSTLGPEDGIILGASKTEQVVENTEAIRKGGPLPDDVVKVIKNIWEAIQPV